MVLQDCGGQRLEARGKGQEARGQETESRKLRAGKLGVRGRSQEQVGSRKLTTLTREVTGKVLSEAVQGKKAGRWD